MKFVLSPEQREFQSGLAKFFTAKWPESALRVSMQDVGGTGPVKPDLLWQQLAEQMGVPGIAIPERFGGSGASFAEVVIIAQEMGRVLYTGPFFSTAVLAANALLESGDESACAELLPGIAQGQTLATLALTEGTRQWGLTDVQLAARQTDDGWTLSGVKDLVVDGGRASLILVVARTVAGLSLFAVQDTETIDRETYVTMDHTRQLARLEFNQTPARLIGVDGGAEEPIRKVLELAWIALAGEQVGGAQRCLDLAVAHSKTREQFGRPIGSFQAIKHRCADMLVRVEGARSAAHYAGWAVSAAPEEVSLVASVAKTFCSDAYFRNAADTIQIHGGIGFTWEHQAHLHFKRAKSSALMFGSPTDHRRLIAQRIFPAKAAAVAVTPS